jgi:hypothetical protein
MITGGVQFGEGRSSLCPSLQAFLCSIREFVWPKRQKRKGFS